MNERERRIDHGAVVTGLIIIAVGVAFLIGRFDDLVRTWWPMILVLIGLPRLLSRRTLWSGVWLIGLGGWLQAVRLHLLGMDFYNSWPLLLILFGAGITLRAVIDAAERNEGAP